MEVHATHDATLNILTAGIWHSLCPAASRWLICAVILVVPCILLSARLKRSFQVRTYRFAAR